MGDLFPEIDSESIFDAKTKTADMNANSILNIFQDKSSSEAQNRRNQDEITGSNQRELHVRIIGIEGSGKAGVPAPNVRGGTIRAHETSGAGGSTTALPPETQLRRRELHAPRRTVSSRATKPDTPPAPSTPGLRPESS